MAEECYNCESCDSKKRNNDPDAHCYMFKTLETPENECAQHSGRQQTMRLQSHMDVVLKITSDAEAIGYVAAI